MVWNEARAKTCMCMFTARRGRALPGAQRRAPGGGCRGPGGIARTAPGSRPWP